MPVIMQSWLENISRFEFVFGECLEVCKYIIVLERPIENKNRIFPQKGIFLLNLS